MSRYFKVCTTAPTLLNTRLPVFTSYSSELRHGGLILLPTQQLKGPTYVSTAGSNGLIGRLIPRLFTQYKLEDTSNMPVKIVQNSCQQFDRLKSGSRQATRLMMA